MNETKPNQVIFPSVTFERFLVIALFVLLVLI